MSFGMLSGVSREMGVLAVGGDCGRERGSFEGNCGESHCNQWGLCSIVVRKCVNRSRCHLGFLAQAFVCNMEVHMPRG